METHRMYFPSSSSSSPSPSAPRAFDNFHGHNHMMSPSSSTGGGRGFHLGFMDNHKPTTPAQDKSIDLVNDCSQIMGSEEINDKGLVINGKKVEKKKIRKPRFAFQTRSQVDILDDGYRWRKYGQKAVKNNKFPRSYYRCTQQECNVKKQVQRLTKDEGVVVTTYEGMHTHPIDKPTDNFENILSQMHVYAPF